MASAALLESIRSGYALHWFIDCTIAGTAYKLATTPARSASGGTYLERIKSISDIAYAAPDTQGGQPAGVAFQIVVRDDDRWWRSIVGASPSGIEFSPFTVKIGTLGPGVTSSDWETVFSGELRSWSFTGDVEATLDLKVVDRALDSERPRACWKLNKQDWPDIPGETENEYAPWIYGQQTSELTTRKGIVPLLRVGDGLYVASAGRLSEVTNCYEDGVLSGASDWSVSYPVRNGKLFTLVTYTSDPGESVAITADVNGYEDIGDGTGDLIEDPPAILAHALTNIYFGDWRSGLWLSTSSLIHSSVTTVTRWADYGHAGSYYLSDSTSGYSLIADWCKSTGGEIWWGRDGTLHLSVDEPTYYWTDYPNSPHIRWERDRLNEFDLQYPSGAPPTSLRGDYFWDQVQGRYAHSVNVENPTIDDDSPDNLQLPFSGAH